MQKIIQVMNRMTQPLHSANGWQLSIMKIDLQLILKK